MALTTIVAGDELPVAITFKSDGVLTSPVSAVYRVEHVDTGEVLREDTAITPIGAEVTVTLSYDDNSMYCDSDSEQHELIVVANFGTDGAGKPRQITRSFKYQVQRNP